MKALTIVQTMLNMAGWLHRCSAFSLMGKASCQDKIYLWNFSQFKVILWSWRSYLNHRGHESSILPVKVFDMSHTHVREVSYYYHAIDLYVFILSVIDWLIILNNYIYICSKSTSQTDLYSVFQQQHVHLHDLHHRKYIEVPFGWKSKSELQFEIQTSTAAVWMWMLPGLKRKMRHPFLSLLGSNKVTLWSNIVCSLEGMAPSNTVLFSALMV